MFNYLKICSGLLKGLPQRTNDVIERRFGLKKSEKETLESIGKSYDITRERVRQIEEEGFSNIKPRLKNYQKVIQYLNDNFESFGGLKKEDVLFSFLGGKKFQNQVFFLLVLADGFNRYSEDNNFHSYWAVNQESADLAKKAVKIVLNALEKEKNLYTLDELFDVQKDELFKLLNKKINKDAFKSYIEISKNIEENNEGRFGLNDWVEINPRGVKDKAYLVLKKEGKPLHFSQVAEMIGNSPCFSQGKVHRATVHNELIKDPRFVLVGRGLYALADWGYESGTVKDVILRILRQAKRPLSKDEVAKEVCQKRMVKNNTIFLNLQDKNYFLRDSQGKYTIKES